ncbi:MAG TPA: LysM peptidoglycan-binding domain-containing protein, partial [Bacteroidales bacterium]|nr:LysM peptidoglycan-binding domain-containing protein [Bacteroidales bacterium]
HFEQIAHVLNINIEEIKTLNPQYKRNVIPAFNEAYPLKLRSNDIMRFLDMKDSIYRYNYDVYFAPLQTYISVFTGKDESTSQTQKKYHKVRSGETISKIATRYGLSVAELKKMNKLKSNYLKVGQRLIVGYEYSNQPKKEGDNSNNTSPATSSDTTSPNTVTNADKSSETTQVKTTPHQNYTIHSVKKGETLSAIASKYHTTVKKIIALNNIKNINQIQVGQKIKVPKN